MSNKRHVPEVFEAFPDVGFYTPQAEARRWGLFARGLRRRGRRRRQASVFLACWLVFSAMIVAILVVVLG
jgi:hypothetical protein